jgi:hypothetical protein
LALPLFRERSYDYGIHIPEGYSIMKEFPEFRLMFSSPHGPLPFDQHGLDAALPITRPSWDNAPESGITYRTYFSALKDFILANRLRVLEILSRNGIDAAQITCVDLIAEKHGSDYHPARVRFHAGRGAKESFVVNAALTERGRQRLTGDFQVLDSLRSRFKRCFVPEAHFLDKGAVKETADELPWLMFMGEWLEGFWEFHASIHNGAAGVVLWDMDKGYALLSESDAEEIYRQAAFILTYYYDIDSCEEIFPWHHAAGDFVVFRAGDSISVKLITVRQYASRLMERDDSPVDSLTALLIFFANLTIRMRLDRLDGIGELVWAGPHCVKGAINGFFDALREKLVENTMEAGMLTRLLHCLKDASPMELAELFQAVTESYDEAAPDLPPVLENLPDHVLLVYQLIQRMPESFIHPEN